MTPKVTLEDGTELFIYPSGICAGCHFDNSAHGTSSDKCLKYAHGLLSNRTIHCTEIMRKDKQSVIFLTKEKYLLRCMTEGAP